MPTRRIRFAVLAVAALALTAACESQTTESPTSTSSPEPSTATPRETIPGAPAVTAAAAQQLCDAIEAELSNWRIQGPTLGKPGLNIVVQTWAAQNGTINIEVLRNRALIDSVTTEHCPEVRQQAMELLEIPDLASGLVGF
ncbi:hypothetical protein [Aldersonia kunmingensis]|uniref:hypothetical protein n=1 Tax=Aldersonia kunmingensis TaxID=408066 RepID=UPI00082DB758|nr:hypothetical protein [Aldersonia kunmingensis]